MSNVKKMVAHKVEVLELREESNKKLDERFRFTVSLDVSDKRRLDYLAKRLECNRSAFATELLTSAIQDVESELGIDVYGDDDYLKYVFFSEDHGDSESLKDNKYAKFMEEGE